MPVLELLAIAGLATVVIGGCMVFGFRVSRSSMAALREQVAAVNATLVELAQRLELECSVAPPHRHPIAGDVPSHARLAGQRRGWAMRVVFESDEDAGNFVVSLAPLDEQRWPDLGWVRSQHADRFPALAPALSMLGDEIAELRVQPRALRAVVGSASASAQELHARVDIVVVLARTLASMP